MQKTFKRIWQFALNVNDKNVNLFVQRFKMHRTPFSEYANYVSTAKQKCNEFLEPNHDFVP